MEILYSTAEVRRRIRYVLRGTGRRVAVVAFVGTGADAYVPNPRGIDLYCWPQASATSARTLTSLMKRGARVHFVDRLHAKVFWSATRGAVVCSANLSTNALGAGDLKEAGVFLPRGLNINRLLRGLRPRPATPEELFSLQRANERAAANWQGSKRSTAPSFVEWYAARPRQRWTLSATSGYGPPSKRAKEVALEDRGERQPELWTSVTRGVVAPEDFMLLVDCTGGRYRSAEWLYVHRVVRVDRSERAYVDGFGFQAIQVYPRRACPPPPFVVDAPLRRALKKVDWEPHDLERPSAALLRELAAGYAE